VDTLYILAVGVSGAILGNLFWVLWTRRRVPPMGPAPEGYEVTIGQGKGGWVTYSEGGQSTRFAWELAAKEGTMVSWIIVPSVKRWAEDVPWAPGRRDEILERIARDVIRQKCPTCRMIIGRDTIEMHVRGS
jgi:hypothetical protein